MTAASTATKGSTGTWKRGSPKKISGCAASAAAARRKNRRHGRCRPTNAGAAAKLMEKVRKGGSGVWGQVPMPPNPQVSDADLKTMISYILALKK